VPGLILHLNFHEPMRLHPEGDRFLWEELNRDIFLNRAESIYLPLIKILAQEVEENPAFCFSVGISGTFLEQAEAYHPPVIASLKELHLLAEKRKQVEFVAETYYHSFSGLFTDPEKHEFRDQVALHRETMRRVFNALPVTFAHPGRMLTDELIRTVGDMGFKVILGGENQGQMGLYRAKEGQLFILPVFMPEKKTSPADQVNEVLSCLAAKGTEGLLWWHDIGGGGISFDFLGALFSRLRQSQEISLRTPIEIPERFDFSSCPEWEIGAFDLKEAFPDGAQLALFREIEAMEQDAKRAGRDLLGRWRYLTTSDHLSYITDFTRDDHPYEKSGTQAAYVLTKKVDGLRMALIRFEILKRAERTAILMISPETGRLPEGMGRLARFISGKSGGQGEVVAALCEGLLARGIDVHLATLNLKKRFQRESQIGEKEWKAIRYNIPPGRIHLVSSAVFADKMHAYEGDPVPTAAEFQRQIVNYVIKDVRARHEGRLIVHSHDWMAGGVITAYARATDLPVLHTVHNVFTAHIPLPTLEGIDINQIYERLFLTIEGGRLCMDAQATAIKNASLINFVGERFLEEIVSDYFWDRPIIPPSVRQEIKVKYYNDAVRVIINAPSPSLYPENCEYLARRFGPADDILVAKRENLVAFQRRTGLMENPDAILFFWPSRLDPAQKGVELLEAIAQPFCDAHPEVQIAIVADGVGNDRYHQEILGRIAWASGGKIAYYPFSEDLSMLGYGAASDVFGASLYEPCGQIDQVANLFGATATNRDTGGYHDKITELQLKIDGAPKDMGNGFLFRDYDAGGLWYGLEKAFNFHRRPPEVREPQLRRIMQEARARYDVSNMIAAYIRVYEWLNGDKPLI